VEVNLIEDMKVLEPLVDLDKLDHRVLSFSGPAGGPSFMTAETAGETHDGP
jgi:hypothetical protein